MQIKVIVVVAPTTAVALKLKENFVFLFIPGQNPLPRQKSKDDPEKVCTVTLFTGGGERKSSSVFSAYLVYACSCCF